MKQRYSRTLSAVLCTVLAAGSLTVMPAMTANAVNLLTVEFETTDDGFTGRGGAKAAWKSDSLADGTAIAYEGKCALFVSGREATWHGATRDVSDLLAAGNTYNMSAAFYQESGEPVEMKFSLQYKDASGSAAYDKIALETVPSGEWTVLSNPAYVVPAGTDYQIYAETTESLTDFYIDTVIVNGPPANVKKGDANGDLSVNLADAVALAKWLTTDTDEIELGADFNGDGKINAIDLSLLKIKLMTPHTSNIDSAYWDSYQETATGNYLKALQASLLNLGNTARIRSKIEKASAGENITIGYIGGSITGGGYATAEPNRFVNVSAQYFSDTFGTGGNVKFINAGEAGTSSVVGNMRVDDQIIAKDCDIIFIEFAVNDQDGTRFQKSYESLVKKCLIQPNEPAVALITLCGQSGNSCQDWMAKVGKNYDVPVISGKNAVMNSGLNWSSDYASTDNLHPDNKGHKLIADCIGYYYRQALRSENEDTEYTVPSTEVFGAEYATAKLTTNLEALENFSAGGWRKNGDNYSVSGGGSPMTFTIEGKGLLLCFQSKDDSSFGTAAVTVNGTTNKVTSNLRWTWGGRDGDVGYYQPESGKLNVSISLDSGSKFTLYGISIIK